MPANEDIIFTFMGKDQASAVMGQVSSSLANLGTAAEQSQGKLSGLSGVLRSIGGAAVAGTAAAAAGVTAIGVASTKTAIDFESSFAGVTKTVDGLRDQFGNLNAAGLALAQGFKDLATTMPVNVNQLNAIGELAGQLGVAKDDILGFTKTIAQLGVTTNLSVEQAASSLAKFQNVTQQVVPAGETMAQNVERLGSTIVALGNNLATTESDIVNMASRLAGVGAQVGLTQDQILGLAGAMSSVGLQAEAGGTAMSTILVKMRDLATAAGEPTDALQTLAATAGMSAAQFKKAFSEDAAGALQAFLEGLSQVEASGGNTQAIFKDLELTGIRTSDTLRRLSGNTELVGSALDIAGEAFGENSALAEEAGQRFNTTASQLEILKNQLLDIGLTIGEAILPSLRELVQGVQTVVADISKAVDGIVKAFQESGLKGAIEETVKQIKSIEGLDLSVNFDKVDVGDLGAKTLSAAKTAVQSIDWSSVASTIGTGISNSISNLPSGVGSTMASMTASFLNMLTTAMNNIDWTSVGAAIGDGLVATVSNLAGFVAAIGSYITTELGNFFTSDELEESVSPFLEALVGAISGIAEGLAGVGVSIAEKIVNALKDKIVALTGDIKTSLHDTLQSAVNTLLPDIPGMFSGIGSSIISGITSGIDSAKGAIDTAVGGAVGKIQGTFNKVTGRGSPAKAFIPIGFDIMRGVAAGMEKGEIEVLKSVADLVKGISSAFEQAFGLAQVIAGGIPGGASESLKPLGDFVDVMLDEILVISQRFRLAENALDENLVKAMDATANTASKAASSFQTVAETTSKIAELAEQWGGQFPRVDPAHAFENLRNLVEGLILQMTQVTENIQVEMLPSADKASESASKAAKAMTEVAEATADIYKIVNENFVGGRFPEVDPAHAFERLDELVEAILRRFIEVAQRLGNAVSELDAAGDVAKSAADILGKVSDITEGIVNLFDAAEQMWTDLQNRFGNTSRLADVVEANIRIAIDALVRIAAIVVGEFNQASPNIESASTEFMSTAGNILKNTTSITTGVITLVDDTARMWDDLQVRFSGPRFLDRVEANIRLAVSSLVQMAQFVVDEFNKTSTDIETKSTEVLGVAVDILGSVTDITDGIRDLLEQVPALFTGDTALFTSIEDAERQIGEWVGTLIELANFIAAQLQGVSIVIDQEISKGLQDLADDVENLVDIVNSVYDIGNLGIDQGEPAFISSLERAIQNIQDTLGDLADVLNGITMPDVDLSWLTDLLDLLRTTLSGTPAEGAISALREAGDAIADILRDIVGVLSGEGIPRADLDWITNVFDMLKALITGTDFKPDVLEAMKTIIDGLIQSSKDIPKDATLKRSLIELSNDLDALIEREVGNITRTVHPEVNIAALTGAVTWSGANWDDIKNILTGQVSVNAVKPTINLNAVAGTTMWATDTNWTSLQNTLTGLVNFNAVKPTIGLTAAAGSILWATDTNWTSLQDSLTGLVAFSAVKPSVGIQADVAYASWKTGINWITLQNNLANTVSLSGVSPSLPVKADVSTAYWSGVNWNVISNDLENDAQNRLDNVSVSTSVKAGIAEIKITTGLSAAAQQVAYQIEDAVNDALGGSLELTAHVKSLGFDRSLIDKTKTAAENVQNIIENGLNATLGRSLKLGPVTVDARAFRGGLPLTQPAPSGGTVHNNYNLTINTQAPTESIVQDFRIMKALAGA